MKPKYVYHGSSRKIKGEKITPKQARDLGDVPNNTLKGIYASDYKNEAIAMAIVKCKGVKGASVHMKKIKGKLTMNAIIYGGSPNQKYIYLYTLPSKTFENRPKGSPQWVSSKSVKPKKIEKLLVEDHIHLIRKATKQEKEDWLKKYGDKIAKK